MNRRQAIASAASSGALLAAGPALSKKARREPTAVQARVKPLPFKSSSLRGLSKALIESHHQKNYAGAVRKLNAARSEVANLDAAAPGFVLGALKSKELTFHSSVLLHELYFANLGGRGGPTKSTARQLDKAFGSVTRFEATLESTALTQAGGSGWTLLSYDLLSGTLSLVTAASHAQGAEGALTLLALDMYEHSYAIDYGADAKRYVNAFYENVNWDVVDDRLARAQKARRAWLA